jgi:CRISPR/Cas system CSM-associated protein Csm3 (group 7 of RAMP superfamily)
MKKRYYRIKFRLASAMSVGSGLNDISDRDILRNSQGKPYIPGTTLAGIYRSLFSKETAECYFGGEETGSKLKESEVMVYDATLQSEKFRIVSRDCVALDEYKTGISGAKFDFEILEPGVSFCTYIEQTEKEAGKQAGEKTEEQERQEEKAEDIGKQIVMQWLAGNIIIGSKTTRGLGKTELESVDMAVFHWKEGQKQQEEEEQNLKQWLKFDMYENDGWEKVNIEEWKKEQIPQKDIKIRLLLKQSGGISIRKYTTAVNEPGKEQPDYEQMAYIRENDKEKIAYPVIPGTSWAGAFRHQMKKINGGCIKDNFGICKNGEKGESENSKSKISFSESEITGAHPKMVTRNALDRFTNATVQGALYTERTYYGGKTELDITLRKDVEDEFKTALAAAIVDLHMGFLAVGGLTSVGRGLFEIEEIKINDGKITADMEKPEELYQRLSERMLEIK